MIGDATYPPSPPPCQTNCVTVPPPTAQTGAPSVLPQAAGASLVLALIGAAIVAGVGRKRRFMAR